MEQNLKDFLRFGLSDRISKKELWKMHAAIFFMEAIVTFAMHLMETPLWTQIFLFVIWGISVLLTCSRQEIHGKRIFFTYGVMSLQMEILFFSSATFFLWMIFGDRRMWNILIAGMICFFLLIHIGYFCLTFYLIRKGAYGATKKVSGGICFLSFASLSIIAGKLLAVIMGQEMLYCFIAFLMYFAAALSALGSMHLFKYVVYCKYEKMEEEKQRKEQEQKEQRKLEKAKRQKKHGKRQLDKKGE